MRFLRATWLLYIAAFLSSGVASAYPFWDVQDDVLLPAVEATDEAATETSSAIQSYVKEREQYVDPSTQEAFEFYIKHLEHKESRIAKDAFANLANQPFEDVKKYATFFPIRKLRRWVANNKLPVKRRDFYGMLIGLRKLYADRSLLAQLIDEFLSKRALREEPMVGVLLGYGLSGSSYAAGMYMKIVRLRNQQPVHTENVLDAAELLYQHLPEKQRGWLPKLLQLTLRKEDRLKVRTIELATAWQEVSMTSRILGLLKSTPVAKEVGVAVRDYCSTIDNDACRQALPKEEPAVDETPPLSDGKPDTATGSELN